MTKRPPPNAAELETARASTISAKAATASAWAAGAALFVAVAGLAVAYLQFRAMREQVRTATRAWVTLLEPGDVVPGTNLMRVHIKNSGQGPALGVSTPTILSIQLIEAPSDADSRLDKIREANKEDWVPFVMGAGFVNQFWIKPEEPVPETGPEHGVLFGRIDYKDQFGEGHTTRFCLKFKGGPNAPWRPCVAFNSAD